MFALWPAGRPDLRPVTDIGLHLARLGLRIQRGWFP